MRYELQILGGNVTQQSGDSLIVTFNSPLSEVTAVRSLWVTHSQPETPSMYFDVDVRWSHDGVSWSAWVPYRSSRSTSPDPFPGIIETGGRFYVNVRATRAGSFVGQVDLTGTGFEFDPAGPSEQPVRSPFADEGCRASSCTVPNSSCGVIAKCDPGMVWSPYSSMGGAISTYEAMSCLTAEMYGHCVRYFRVVPDSDSADAVLKEYSVFDAVDVKDIKVLVKGNEFPDNGFNYTEFDMDFQEGLEIHVLRQHFEAAFGQGTRPQEKDYLYFPLIDRLFEVHASYLKRGFMQHPIYHRVMLYKAQNRDNVLKDRANPSIGEYTDSITDDFEELLRGDLDKQEQIITKPLQYRTISVGGYDHVRSLIHESLLIKEQDIENYFTLVSKHHYDMTSVPTTETAVSWKHTLEASASEPRSFSFWIEPGPTAGEQVVFHGQTGGSTGASLFVGYTGGGISSFRMQVGSTSYSFTGVTGVTAGWHGVVLNLMPAFGQAHLSVWRMRPESDKTTNLTMVYTKTVPYNQGGAMSGGVPMWAPGSSHKITNLRVWKAPIEEEKQALVLNQYVVRDSHLSLLVDNAVPPLRMPRMRVR